jgi:hypothetical protein
LKPFSAMLSARFDPITPMPITPISASDISKLPTLDYFVVN